MSFSSWNAFCKPVYSELKIMIVPSPLIFKSLLMVLANYKTWYSENFKHDFNTRFTNNFQYPKHRLQLVEKTPSYMRRNLFNKLSLNIKLLIYTL